MKLQHLRFFIAVVDCGGVVRAAERLRISQPSISAGLKALEEELGQSLFRRRGAGRSLRPTPKALRFYDDAREILRRCGVARARFTTDEPRLRKLRIGVLQTIASYDVATFSSALTLHNPDLRLQVWEGGAIRVGEWLRQGRIDATWTIVDKDAGNARVLWQNHSSSSVPEPTPSLRVITRSCQSRILRDSPSSCDSAAKRSGGDSGPRAPAYASSQGPSAMNSRCDLLFRASVSPLRR
jgi:DNA-binding transcriptional LysR family regulator